MKDYYRKMPRKFEIVRNIFVSIELENDAKILDVGGVGSYYGILKGVFPRGKLFLLNINPDDVRGVSNSIIGDSTRLPFKDETYDVITSFDMIEHLINPDDFLAEAFRVLKRGGGL